MCVSTFITFCVSLLRVLSNLKSDLDLPPFFFFFFEEMGGGGDFVLFLKNKTKARKKKVRVKHFFLF